jgi:hypothetical protein
MKHHEVNTKLLAQLISEISEGMTKGVIKQWIDIDTKIGNDIQKDPKSAALLIVFLKSSRQSISMSEMRMISEGKVKELGLGFSMWYPFMEALQIGYNLALRELGLDDTKNVSNGTRPTQA